MKAKWVMVISAVLLIAAVAVIVIRTNKEERSIGDYYVTEEPIEYGPRVNEKQEGWKDLEDWEIDFDEVPNFEMLDPSMGWIEIHSMLGTVIKKEGWTDYRISVDMSKDSMTSSPNIYHIALHGDIDCVVNLDVSNFTYSISY